MLAQTHACIHFYLLLLTVIGGMLEVRVGTPGTCQYEDSGAYYRGHNVQHQRIISLLLTQIHMRTHTYQRERASERASERARKREGGGGTRVRASEQERGS
jgi:hypothetical protein